ncbi:hypothetical protein GCM10010123_07890 [Pilimelia anulata]|uniref:Uncharacterized protein n=1 Tax=Pilimelia anulata TaxID=53371 RepID=A0A8J3B0D5_9ACTN|nr:hypothetical protein [Pilimelia anulata]GGJ80366.1 hypothetical protein GCM10010123_07890 [Pilimelia anulata]
MSPRAPAAGRRRARHRAGTAGTRPWAARSGAAPRHGADPARRAAAPAPPPAGAAPPPADRAAHATRADRAAPPDRAAPLGRRSPAAHPAAADHPARAGRRRWIAALAAAGVLVVAAAAAAAYAGRRGWRPAALARSVVAAEPAAIAPAGARASSSAPGVTPGLLYDGTADRFWAPASAAPGQWAELRLARPTALRGVRVRPGASSDPLAFLTAGRPRDITITAAGPAGAVATVQYTLRDAPEPQSVPVRADGVTTLRVTIRSGYGRGARPALGELELLPR